MSFVAAFLDVAMDNRLISPGSAAYMPLPRDGFFGWKIALNQRGWVSEYCMSPRDFADNWVYETEIRWGRWVLIKIWPLSWRPLESMNHASFSEECGNAEASPGEQELETDDSEEKSL